MKILCPEKYKQDCDDFQKNIDSVEENFVKFVIPARTDLVAGP
jgi:hypothetical protein